MIGKNLFKKLKEKETKIMYYLKSKYSSEKIENIEKDLRKICGFLIFVNMCTVVLHMEVLAKDIEETIRNSENELTVIVSEEINAETVSTDTIDDFSNQVSLLSSNDAINANEENLYTTKRLIVLSNTPEFETYDASSVVNFDNLYVLQFETEEDCKYAYEELVKDTTILSVEIDVLMGTEDNDTNNIDSISTSTKTELGKYLDSIDSTNEVKVAILDTGIDNSKFKNIIDLGINLSSSGEENSIVDDNGHGTEMATIITSNSNEMIKLMPIKIANSEGKATVLNTYLGILKAIENDADIINISMNTVKSATSQILETAINEASNKGILVVVSAGNNSMNTDNVSPANLESAIVVSAIDNNNNFASYSNYGTTVDYSSYGIYENKNGTSYAAANVTGIIADLLSKKSDISILNQYVVDLGDEGKDVYYGNGLISNQIMSLANNETNETINNIFDDWKNISDNVLDEYLTQNSDEKNAFFLQSLSDEELTLILTKDTCLIKEYGYYDNFTGILKNEIYYKYLLSMDLSELNVSATYEDDAFGELYSKGYIRNRDKNDVIKTSGVSIKLAQNIRTDLTTNSSHYNNEFYTANNTSKSAYIDYSKAARYVNDKGDPIWLDMRIYVWTNNAKYPWALRTTNLSLLHLFDNDVQKTTMEFHFYEAGTLNTGNEKEVDFKGVLRISDMDTYEGVYFYSGYNKFYRANGTYVKYVEKGAKNSDNENNPFSQDTSKTASHPYFFGTALSNGENDIDDENKQHIWIEVNSKTSSPFKYQYATRNAGRGSSLYYQGTAIRYYVDGEEKDTYYCVPYGSYSLMTPSKIDGQKTGYKIDGWYTKNDYKTKASGGTASEEVIKVYGKYVANIATIRYHANGGSANSGYTLSSSLVHENGTLLTKAVSYATSTFNLHNATSLLNRIGYHIDASKAWRINSTSGDTISQDDGVSATPITNLVKNGNATVTLYANWQPITYYVAYNGNGATSGSTATSTHTYDVWQGLTPNGYQRAYTVTYNYNGNGQANSTATATYIFNNWTDGTNSYANTQGVLNLSSTHGSTVVLYANWTPTSVTLPLASRTGYIFAGWYDAPTGGNKIGDAGSNYIPTDNKTLYAQWIPITYYIDYNGNGATSGSTATSTHTYDVAKNLTTNGYVRQYTATYNYNGNGQANSTDTATYVFNGWATSSGGAKVYNNAQSVINLSTTNGSRVPLYANWSSASVILPTPSRTGYIFAGWYDAPTGGNKIGDAGANYTPTYNKTLYAHWTPITYYIAYDGNGATSGSTATSTHTYDVAKNLTTNGYVRQYTVTYNYNGNGQANSTDTATYVFNGWATSASGARVYNNNQNVVNLTSTHKETIALYANWTATSVILPTPTRIGHNFIGWYDAPTGGNKIGDAGDLYTPSENKTLYAYWEPWTLNTNINLIDKETKNTIHENANLKVYEYNINTGNYDIFIMNLTQREDKTYITPNFLTYSDTNLGKFRIIEETAPYGYYGDWLDATEIQKKYYDINIEEIIRTKNYFGQTVADKGTINITIENTRVKAKVDVNIIDTETRLGAQADATLEGAVYGIYAKENILHSDGVTGILYKQGSLVQRATIQNGKLLYENLELGEYYIQQITPPNGYTQKDTKYNVSLPYEGEKVELVERNITVEEKVNKQAFQLIKVGNVGDNDEFETLEGAGFKIYLISSLSRVKNGEIVPNANGTYNLEDFKDYDFSTEETAIDYTNKSEGENISEIFTDESGYLLSPELAYGQYIVYESTVPEERVEIKPFFVTVQEDNRTPKKLRVFYDAEFTAKIQVIKKDAKTNKIVLKANAQYRILNKETNEYVEQWITYPSKLLLGTEKNPYTTDDTGTMTTPLTLNVGEYELQEVTAPEGYVLLGNEGKSQQGTYISTSKENISFKISKTMVMEFDEDTKEAIIKVEQYNEEQLGSLTIDVSGEYLSGYSKDNNQNYKFDYQVRPIPGVEFTLYAKYNIYSQDNQKDIVYNKDEIVKTVYSDDEGKCIIDNLPLGIYYIKQTQTVNGFVLNKEIKEVEITYEGQEKAVVYRNVNYNNDRQKVEITLLKRDIETNERLSGAKFALYTKENINYIDLNGMAQTINADEMIYEVTTDENGIAKWKYGENVDLPLGMYYIKEVKAPEGYVTNNNIIDINAKYRGQHEDVIENNQEFTNQKTKVMIIKQDVETKNALSDVEMKLLNSNREELYSWTTDETGKKEILKLQPGETYILQEIKQKQNYINEMIIEENQNNIEKIEDSEVEEITFKVNDVLDVQNIVIGNKSKVGNINIIKKGDVLIGTERDYEGNINFKYELQNLAGAEYEIYTRKDIVHPDGHTGVIISAGTKVANAITTTDGILVTKIEEQLLTTYSEEIQKMLQRGLPLGEYDVKETKAPKGYYIDEENSIKEINLNDNEVNDEIIYANSMFVNKRCFIGLTDTENQDKVGIYKYDEESKQPIQNAIFGIYSAEDIVENGNIILEKDTLILKGRTDENGQIKSKIKLPLGKYYIQEIEAAKGYEYSDEKFEIDFSNETVNQEIYNMYVEISNKQTEINILKTDVEGNAIEGAILELQDEEGNVLEQWTSTKEAHNIKTLEIEKQYKIKEIAPARGYVTEEEKYFSLDKYGNIVTDENNLYNQDTIIIKDEKTKIQIIVVDEKTQEKIIGVHVQILDKQTNEIVYEFDTEEEKLIIEGLPIGDYDIIQRTDIDGYVTTHNTITIQDKKGIQENVLNQNISKLIIKVKDTEENEYIDSQKIEIKDIETGNVIASTEKDQQETILIIQKTQDGYYVERLPIKEHKLEVEVLEGYDKIDQQIVTIVDTEELQEIEVGTRKLILNMKIEKHLERISIDNKAQNVNKNSISKIEIHKKLINSAKIELEYIIKVTNIGEISGNIGKIIEEMPEGMQFDKDKSDYTWEQQGNTLISTEYANKELQVGESIEYRVVLKWINSKNNFGSKVNTVRLEGITNKLNYKDNNEQDNNSSVITLFTVATGVDENMIIEIINTVLLSIVIIGTLSIIEIKIFSKKK